MSKKLLYTILAGALSISVLAACGDAADDPAGGGVDDTPPVDAPPAG